MANDFMNNPNRLNNNGIEFGFGTPNLSETVSAIEADKAVTISVKEYTEPVEVTPTEPNKFMGKVTVTLDTSEATNEEPSSGDEPPVEEPTDPEQEPTG